MKAYFVLSTAVLLCGVADVSAQIDTTIVPWESRTTWAPGIQGGIPARTTICATVNASSYGNGSSEASGGIQAAIGACAPGQTVLLSAGTFLANDLILINKGITLRGAGPGRTTLVKTNGAKPMSYQPAEAEPVVVIGPNRWPKVNNATSVNLAADGAKGATSVTVSSAAGFAAGQVVLLDEDDYATASWLPLPNRNGQPNTQTIWATDRIVFQRHNPTAQYIDDPFPDSLTWFSRSGRPLGEIKEIRSVVGNTITFTTPLHAAYPMTKLPQLTRYFEAHVRDAGLEDMTITGGSDANVRFEVAAYSWTKNVEHTTWLGEAIGINHSFRAEIRDSHIHDTAWPYPGGGGYGISFAFSSSEVLIENNIVNMVNKVIVVRSAGAGSVVGYNYMDNGYIFHAPEWQEVGLNGSHMVGGHHVLFEGNESWNYDSDNTHGNAFAMTIFRNHLSGKRSRFPDADGRAAGLMLGSYWHAFIGNVLGNAGQMSGWTYEDPGDGSLGNAWGPGRFIWRFGYDPTAWDQAADPKVKSTALRDGNFDFLTNQVRWERTARTLPDSLYLTAKPAFFGSHPWPWVNPNGTTKLGVLPARQRAESIIGRPPERLIVR